MGSQAGLPGWFAELLSDVYQRVFAVGGAARVTEDVPRVLGRRARGLAEFGREYREVFLGPAAA